MQVLMRGKRVGVEKPGRATSSKSFLAMPDDTWAIGYIRFLGKELTSSDLKVGMKIAFGPKREQIKLNGMDIVVMDEDNVYAIVEDESAETHPSP